MSFSPDDTILAKASNNKLQLIRAFWDDEGIYFYQAYNQELANYALEHQTFGGPLWGDRMTWIKPSFAWMLYRCGYGDKRNQERVLRIKLSQSAAKIFEKIRRKWRTLNTKFS